MKNLTFIYFSLCVCLSFFGVVKVQNQNLDSYFLTLFSTMSTARRNYLQKLFHFKKRTQHHQTILLSNEAECSQSRATENWTRKYSTERHYLYLHNHSLCRWKKTYIFICLYEALRTPNHTDSYEVKRMKQPVSFLWCSSGHGAGTLKCRDQKVFQAAEASGCPCQALGTQRNETSNRGRGRRKPGEFMLLR